MQAQREADQPQGPENAPVKQAAGRGRKAATAAHDGACDSWDWSSGKKSVLLVINDVMQLDLKALFKGLPASERLVTLCIELALLALDSPSIAHAKQEAAWLACQGILVRGAVLYQQLELVAASLLERSRKHEHVPALATRMAKYAEEHFNSTQLGVMLLAEFCRTSPEAYDVQYTTNQVSVRLAGDVVLLLAEQLPKVVSNQVSQLRPYLGCAKAHCIRGALMAATGSILMQVFRSDVLSSSMGDGAASAHLRSKEALLALLHDRMLDKAALVRQKVLQTWGRLVEESCVPLSHWNFLLSRGISLKAIDRLQDESQLVVKAAVQLLYKMVQQSIFQPPLKLQVYLNTLQQAEAELLKLQPAHEAEEEQILQAAATTDAAGRDGGAAWEKGSLQINEEPVDCDMEELQKPDNATATSPAAAACKAASHDATVHRLRTLVASLKEGASFCKRLTAALPQLQALLANPAAGVVHDVIVLLTLCKTYEVQGAAKALRGMWPLVFSKHEPVKQAVLDSWHVLHLHDKLGKQQLEELLLHVLPGSSLSELTALESIVGSLVQQEKLEAHSLMRLLVHDICCHYQQLRTRVLQQQHEADGGARTGANNESIDNDEVDATGKEAAPQDMPEADQPGANSSRNQAAVQSGLVLLRSCFSLLSMVTAAKPSVLDVRYIPVLLEEVLAAIIRLLIASPDAGMAANWPSAAEAAVSALYALSNQPEQIMAVVLGEMFRRCSPVAEEEDIGELLGVGSVAADAQLDGLAEAVEAQMMAGDQLLGKYGQLLSSFCHLKRTLEVPQPLLASALLALTQMMAVNSNYCSSNVALLFTLLLRRHVAAGIRVNMVVALADLAGRFPNVLEPWTDHIYQTLADPEPRVRLAALSSLTHLVLGGMLKAKGNVAEVAVLLVDREPEIVDRAVLFFDSLAKTGSGSSRASASAAAAGASAANPVYNLLPDCLSKLLAKVNLTEEQVQVVMGQLLAYVKDKQAESLRERLAARLQGGGPRDWRLVAWCIGHLGFNEKGLRKLMDLLPCYRHALAEQQGHNTAPAGLSVTAAAGLQGDEQIMLMKLPKPEVDLDNPAFAATSEADSSEQLLLVEMEQLDMA
eukprot:gene7726-7925_t